MRGLKCGDVLLTRQGQGVAPLAGAWIEMAVPDNLEINDYVAPLAGAWIEMRQS